jgi:putative colanic acid biosynthesis acetyltransferase WcaF
MFTAIYNIDTHVGASFSLRNRLGRAVWRVVAALLFRLSPRPLHKWQALLLRLFGAKVGRRVHVYPRAEIWVPRNLELDEAGSLLSFN